MLITKTDEEQRREFYEALRTKITLHKIASDYIPLFNDEIYPEETTGKLERILVSAGINPEDVKEQGLSFGKTVRKRITFATDLLKDLEKRVYRPLCSMECEIASLNNHDAGKKIMGLLETDALDNNPELKDKAKELLEKLKHYTNRGFEYPREVIRELLEEAMECDSRIPEIGIPTESWLIPMSSPTVTYPLEDNMDLLNELEIKIDTTTPNFVYYHLLETKLKEITDLGVNINNALLELSIAHTMNVMGTSMFSKKESSEEDEETETYTMGRSIYLNALMSLIERKASIDDEVQTEEELFVQRCAKTLLEGYVGTVQERLVYNYDEIRSLGIYYGLHGCDFEYVDTSKLPTYEEFQTKTDGGSPKELNLRLGSSTESTRQ